MRLVKVTLRRCPSCTTTWSGLSPILACCAPPCVRARCAVAWFPWHCPSRHRLEWEDLSGKDRNFRVKDVAGVLNEHLLRAAKAEARALGASSAAASAWQQRVPPAVLSRAPVSPRGSTSEKPKCSYCLKFGHTAGECRSCCGMGPSFSGPSLAAALGCPLSRPQVGL